MFQVAMTCAICGSPTRIIFEAPVLNKYPARYCRCSRCGFVNVADPTWLEEAYRQPINPEDTGILARNLEFSKAAAILIARLFDPRKTFLDYAGGYGIFVRLMRDYGFDFYWHDPFSQNLLARGFEYRPGQGKAELLTAFECFEHFTDPAAELKKMTALSDGLLFSTILLPDPVPRPEDWWYYGRSHGQHLSFYTPASLELLAEKSGLIYHQLSENLHLMSRRRLDQRKLQGLMKPSARDGLFTQALKSVTSLTRDDYLKISGERGSLKDGS